MKLKAGSLVVGVLGFCNTVAAYTGSELLNLCETESEYTGCIAYVRGVVEGHSMTVGQYNDLIKYQGGEPWLVPFYCIPEGVTAGQLEKIVVKYLRAEPEKLHFYASHRVTAALMETFPCEQK